MATEAMEMFRRAFEHPEQIAAAARAAGKTVIRTVGTDAPREILLAAGLLPIRLVGGGRAPTPNADAIMGGAELGPRGRRLLEQLLAPEVADAAVLITKADSAQPQIFAALRELARLGEGVAHRVHFLDLLHIDRPSSRAYNRARLQQLCAWLEQLTGRRIEDGDIRQAIDTVTEQSSLLAEIAALRSGPEPRLSGTQMLHIVGSAAILPPHEHVARLRALRVDAMALGPLRGRRLYLTGSAHEDGRLYELIESLGAVIVGEDHAWGDPFHAERVSADCEIAGADALDALAHPGLRLTAPFASPEARAARLGERVAACRADAVLHLTIDRDETAPWDVAPLKRMLPPSLPCMVLRTSPGDEQSLREPLTAFLHGGAGTSGAAPAKKRAAPPKPPRHDESGQRSRKSLRSVAAFGAYQRQWFADVRRRVADGAPFAVVNANAPQEILRALDIPFVVNQWWASIVAAKQQSRRYLDLLRTHDLPFDVEAYSSQGLAAAFDEDPALAPWDGLPKPDFVHAIASSDPTPKIFEHWAEATGAECFVYERTVDPRWQIVTRWWEELPERWDEALEAERIDLLVAEMREVIARIEARTDRRFSQARFEEVMALVNEQEDYYRRTRDLIAATTPAPIGIVDSMPATMVPQWHRGTVWARDAARAFHDEVVERVRSGAAAVPKERVRLMWVGRGLWSDMGFYQKWEESHGAVFVWSMYLALAADGYIRRHDGGRDPMRALAARFLTMGDELRMPSWAGPWHVHEAETHRVDGAVALADADPFVLRALVHAGVPVLQLGVDNFNREGSDPGEIEARVTAFIEGPAGERSRRQPGAGAA